ncbi:hypothetical protein [Hymenobacter arizonensis]|uniref:Por secretion system C-terminal sorting domain-containing protein n=1 Tax=Hymenobacter arizonensis TaxID=1227077 RepID=A0A1I6AGQ8_HYMAR|nr:hypothetical protein [Hymenobacter arizonensis]SFQ67908.1 hypothetical protein SAMN04515668_3667 [Hymenobacter arizonensis]
MAFTNVLRTQSSRLALSKIDDAPRLRNHSFSNGLGQTLTAFDAAVSTNPLSPATDSRQAATTTISTRGFDRETGGQFTLGQNDPNPYFAETTIPFTLVNGGDVRLDLFDLLGRKMASIPRPGMSAGAHTIHLNLSGLGLAAGDYSYQLQVVNSRGVFRQCKMMTAG